MKSDGGSAFPSHSADPELTDPRNRISCGGMSLRDWFAGQALAGLMADQARLDAHDLEFAKFAYDMADAMLKAREE